MANLRLRKNGCRPTGFGVVLVFLLLSACVSIDADFLVRISSLKAAWGSEDEMLKLYVNQELHQNLANEIQEFSNVRISVKDGEALLPHLGRFSIEVENDSNDECHIEFEGRKSVVEPSEKKRYRLNYTNAEVYGKEGFRALEIGGCLF